MAECKSALSLTIIIQDDYSVTEVDAGHCGGGSEVEKGHLLNETFSLPVKHIIVHDTDNEACLSGSG